MCAVLHGPAPAFAAARAVEGQTMTVTQRLIPNLDELRPGFTDDPYPMLDELRARGPAQVHINGMRVWFVTRYRDVRDAFVNPAISNNAAHASDEAKSWDWIAANNLGVFPNNIAALDPPDHTRLRRLVGREFTVQRVERLRPRIEAIVEELVGRFRHRGSVELIEEFAAPLAITVIAELFGVPVEQRQPLRQWSDIVAGVEEGDSARVFEAFGALRALLEDLIEHKRRQPERGSDLLSGLITVHEDEDRLTRDELLSTAWVMLFAGHTTTLDLIGNGTLALLRNPGQLAALRADPALLGSAVEECLRYDGPVNAPAVRFAKEDVRVGEATIPAGDVILLWLTGANRDPDRFADAGTMDILRRDRHLAFGHGIHHCVGAPLARLEATTAFRALLSLPDLALDAGQPLRWRLSMPLRGLRNLPLTFGTNSDEE